MSSLLLLRPPGIFASSSYSVPVTMPQGLAYLAGNLLRHGHEVRCLDAFGEGLDHIDVSYAPSVRYRLALTLAQKGDADGARENLNRALEMDPFPEVQAAKAELARLESD